MGGLKMLKYTYYITIGLMIIVILLIITGMGQDGTASTLIGAISGFWLGQSTNEKQGANKKQGS